MPTTVTHCFYCDEVKPIYEEVFCRECYEELIEETMREEN